MVRRREMDTEKSSNSSFEDLSNVNEQDANKTSTENKQPISKDKLNTTENNHISIDNTNRAFIESPEHLQGGMSSLSKSSLRKSPFHDDPEMPELEQIEPVEKPKACSAKSPTDMISTLDTDVGGDAGGSGLSGANMSTSPTIGEDEPCDILGNGQLLKRILIKAPKENRRPLRGELVTIDYKGMLDDGTVVEKVDEIKVHVGDFEVVQAIDMILPLMNIGETAKVSADSRFCYSSLGLKNEEKPELTIPPNANVRQFSLSTIYIIYKILSF